MGKFPFSPVFSDKPIFDSSFLRSKSPDFLVVRQGAPHMRLAFERDASAPVHDEQGHLKGGAATGGARLNQPRINP